MRLEVVNASCSFSTNPSEPGGVGTPAFFARLRLTALSSNAVIAREFGPMNRMLQLSQTSAKWAFSDRNPYPG
jgi:hypothetical protein